MSEEKIVLKPCPFCGSEDLLFTQYSIHCNGCAAVPFKISLACTWKEDYKKKMLAASWNKRVGQ